VVTLEEAALDGWIFRAGASRVALGQTFEVGGKRIRKQQSSGTQPASNLGWGSGIEVARQVRAAQDALNQGDYASAVSHADQAAKAAPQDAEIWFLLGYCARLAEHYQVQWTLTSMASNATQLRARTCRAGTTYVKMGRDVEARQVLLQVVQANPKDPDSLALAGELFLDSDASRALDLPPPGGGAETFCSRGVADRPRIPATE